VIHAASASLALACAMGCQAAAPTPSSSANGADFAAVAAPASTAPASINGLFVFSDAEFLGEARRGFRDASTHQLASLHPAVSAVLQNTPFPFGPPVGNQATVSLSASLIKPLYSAYDEGFALGSGGSTTAAEPDAAIRDAAQIWRSAVAFKIVLDNVIVDRGLSATPPISLSLRSDLGPIDIAPKFISASVPIHGDLLAARNPPMVPFQLGDKLPASARKLILVVSLGQAPPEGQDASSPSSASLAFDIP
jgi:hypothetical protein